LAITPVLSRFIKCRRRFAVQWQAQRADFGYVLVFQGKSFPMTQQLGVSMGANAWLGRCGA
jgi:hypothetical protein